MKMKHWVAAAMTIVVEVSAGYADVRLPRLIADNMVLQRDMATPVWGWAEPGEEVTVAIADKTVNAKAGADGKWRVTVGPLAAGGPYDMQIKGKNALTVKNVLVGEVWICSGQSNLIFRVGENTGAKETIAAAEFPNIRLFVIDRDVASKPLDDIDQTSPPKWSICSPKTVGGFSAVGYFFGRDVHKALNVPVGLIQAGVTDTRVEYYMSKPVLQANPEFASVYERWARWKKEQNLDADFPNIEENMHEVYWDQRPMLKRWDDAVKQAKAEGKEPPAKPKELPWRIFKNYPSGQYNSIIHPLMPMGIRGVVWYQGEGNTTGESKLYRKLLPAMIANWRAEWGEGDFPFLFVQLPRIEPPPPNDGWELIREAQLMTVRSEPNTGMAVTCDLEVAPGGDVLHPPQKEPFGQRLALIARGMVYGEKLVYSGPQFKEAKREGAKFHIAFDHADGGLTAKDGKLTGFVIAGEDKQFQPADAVIEGQTVVVSNSQVAQPASVRYAWEPSPQANLCNGAGLPASPFRTDDWPPEARK